MTDQDTAHTPYWATPRRDRLSPRAAYAVIATVSLALWKLIGVCAAGLAIAFGVAL